MAAAAADAATNSAYRSRCGVVSPIGWSVTVGVWCASCAWRFPVRAALSSARVGDGGSVGSACAVCAACVGMTAAAAAAVSEVPEAGAERCS